MTGPERYLGVECDGEVIFELGSARGPVTRVPFDDRVHLLLAEHAEVDGSSGLPGREHLLISLQAAGTDVGVGLVRIEGLTRIADSLGQGIADELFARIADGVVARVAEVLIVRFADDVLGLCGVADAVSDAVATAVAAVEEPVNLYGRTTALRARGGVATLDGAGSPADAIRQAETALRSAEAQGVSVERYSPALQQEILAGVELEHALRHALRTQELVVHYQPIIEVASGRRVGAEALVRWERPGVGMIPPGEFLPVAEQTGLITDIDRWVLRAACRDLAHWRGRGEEMGVSVNLSAAEFAATELPAVVAESAADAGVPAGLLTVEITETGLMADVGASRSTLEGLRELGVRVAIDDFGTGYSSLAYLRRFPLDALKIDRSFVTGLGADPADGAIVGAVIELARLFGFSVVAEGVETEDQLQVLRDLGCGLVQGYLLGRPQPASAL